MGGTGLVVSEVFAQVLEATWQASLMAIVILGVQRLLRRRCSAQTWYLLWGLVVVRFLLPALPASPVSAYQWFPASKVAMAATSEPPRPVMRKELSGLASPAAHGPLLATPRPDITREPQGSEVDAQERPPLRDDRTPTAAASGPDRVATAPVEVVSVTTGSFEGVRTQFAMVWLAGVLLLVAQYLIRGLFCARAVRRGQESRDKGLAQLVRECAAMLRLRRDVPVVETARVHGPALFGWGRARVLVPPGFFQGLNNDERRHILLHELAHMKRGDLWVNHLLSAMSFIHWFNPAVHWIVRRIRSDMEAACDATVLKRLDGSEVALYGKSLLGVLENLQTPTRVAGTLGAWQGKWDVWRRFRAIAEYRTRRGYGWLAAAIGLVLAAVALTSPEPAGETLSTAPLGALPAQLGPAAGSPAATSNPAVPGQVVINVVDGSNGQPLPGVNIDWHVTKTAAGEKSGQTRSDARGRATLAGTEDGWEGLKLAVGADDYWSWEWEFTAAENPAGRPTELWAMLLPIRPLGGRVVDLDGQPVANARVRFSVEGGAVASRSRGLSRITVDELEALSNDSGNWSLPRGIGSPTRSRVGLAAPIVRMEVECEGYITGLQSWGGDLRGLGRTPRAPGQDEPLWRQATWPTGTNMVLKIGRPRDIAGRVVDEKGSGVPGATLTFTPMAWPRVVGPGNEIRLETGLDGGFVLTNVAPMVAPFEEPTASRWGIQWGSLQVEALGYVPVQVQVAPSGSDSGPFIVVLEPGYTARGRLMDAEGEPMAGHRVFWAGGTPRSGLGAASVRTGSDGRFEVGPVPPGEVEVQIGGMNTGTLRRTLRTGQDEQVIVLPREARIEVAALDSTSGAQISEFTVYLVRPELVDMAIDPNQPLGDPFPSIVATNGVVRVLVKDAEQLGLPANYSVGTRGHWWVKVEAPGYASVVSEPFLPAEGVSLRVPMETHPWLSGTVLTPDGAPAIGAKVAYLPDPYPGDHLQIGMIPPPEMLVRPALLRLQPEVELTVTPCLQTAGVQTSDSNGSFALPPRNPAIRVEAPGRLQRPFVPPRRTVGTEGQTNDVLVFVHSAGFAEIAVKDFQPGQRVELLPYGSLEVQAGRTPQEVHGWSLSLQRERQLFAFSDPEGPPDATRPEDGAWFFPRLAPGRYGLAFMVPTSFGASGRPGGIVEVLPGVTNRVQMWGDAWTLNGRLTLRGEGGPVSWKQQTIGTQADPVMVHGGPEVASGLFPAGPDNQPSPRRGTSAQLVVDEEGRFTVSAVEPGDYTLVYTLFEGANQIDFNLVPPLPANGSPTPFGGSGRRSAMMPRTLGINAYVTLPSWTKTGDRSFSRFAGAYPNCTLSSPVKIPPTDASAEGAALDLGELQLQPGRHLNLGEKAPAIRGSGRNGEQFELEALRGKWTMLVFHVNGSFESDQLNRDFSRYAEDLRGSDKVVVVVLDLDPEAPADAPTGRPLPEDLPGPVVSLGPWRTSSVAEAYCVRAAPEVVLVDPEGRIAAFHLFGEKLFDVLDAISPPSAQGGKIGPG